MATRLRFREDSTFTVAQFTDLHWQNGDEADLRTRRLMEAVLDRERPDLVIFTGDVIDSGGCRDPRASFRQAVAPVEERAIPWAAVFGNHDAEYGVTREELMAVQQACRCCLSEPGPTGVSGVGNYVLRIHGAASDRVAAVLYCLDSGSYAPQRVGGYDWIRRDQIAWYVRESAALAAASGGPLPALAFFHIPLPEYAEVWERRTCYGTKLEEVCCPRLNSGFFQALVEMGDVMATFVGHDHINDYWGELYGIRLCYGRATGFNTYGREGFARGARMIRLYEGRREFDSWLLLDDGTVVTLQPEHPPERRG
jgi:3',5'-cyclic AMP phosphodiesterase CpdA